MKPSEKYYENFGGNRVVPENRLEEQVLRQAILADKWDLAESEREALDTTNTTFHFLLCRSGGMATYQPQWSPDLVVHYQIGRHRDDGFFDLTMKILSAKTGEPTGSVELFAALKFQKHPPFQTGWIGPEREHHFIPFWYFNAARAHSKGIKLKVERDLHGAMLVPGDLKVGAEWHCSPPHVTLLDI
jgi:hypothetical protein